MLGGGCTRRQKGILYIYIFFFIFLLGDSQKEMRRSFVFALSPIPTGNPDVFLSALWSLVLVLSILEMKPLSVQ